MSISEQQEKRSLRQGVISYARRRYGTPPEHLWSNAPNYVVFRHQDSGKWFGLIMDVPAAKLGMPGFGKVDILEIKCSAQSQLAGFKSKTIIPAYHMKRGDWVAVRLDGSVQESDILRLLEESYRLTASAPKRTQMAIHYEEDWPPRPFDDAAVVGRAYTDEAVVGRTYTDRTVVGRTYTDEAVMGRAYAEKAVAGRAYTDEPLRLSPERKATLAPPQYRQMRELAIPAGYGRSPEAAVFYKQAVFMADFEDDCPFDGTVQRYFPTYRSLSLPELRGYFTWRTKWRHGQQEKTSLSYAFLRLYELINGIGSDSAEEGLEQLLAFGEAYAKLDPAVTKNFKRWVADYVLYHRLPLTPRLHPYFDLDFDEAILTLQQAETASDQALFQAIQELSGYSLEKSKAYKERPKELAAALCAAYREMSGRYVKRYGRPYTDRLFTPSMQEHYVPFENAVFYWDPALQATGEDRREYRVSPVQAYYCRRRIWLAERPYGAPKRSKDLGTMVRAADRLVREAYGLKPALKPRDEGATLVKLLTQSIAETKAAADAAARPRVEFDLSKLAGIRQSSEATAQRVMTAEERFEETPAKVGKPETGEVKAPAELAPEVATPQPSPIMEEGKDCPDHPERAAGCPNHVAGLTPEQTQFLRLLLADGDWRSYLRENHLMASVVAEGVNEALFDTFADTVIEFEGDVPTLVEDYRQDVEGLLGYENS